MESTSSDTLSLLAGGLSSALTLDHLALGITGVVVGTAIGVMPGLGPAVAIALLLPMTFGLEPTSAFIIFGGIYYGAMYGGAITSILVNTPGDAPAVVTTFDGFPMAQSGQGGKALMLAAIGSCIGGTFATLMLALMAPVLIIFALQFGAADYFSLMLFALITAGAVASSDSLKAAFAVCFGLLLSMIGIDLQSGEARGTFGIPQLYNGIDIVLASVGLFAVGEVLWVAAGGQSRSAERYKGNRILMLPAEWIRAARAWVRGALVGFGAGVLPGAGSTLATFMSYGFERRISKRPEEFGKGAIEGVAGPEAANNAAAGGSMIPLLSLGIPGSATTAVMLAAFQLYGLQPGPLLFTNNSDLVWTLIASLLVANLLLVAINLPLVGVWARLLRLRLGYLYSGVLVFASVGAYGLHGSIADLVIVWTLGVIAFVFRRLNVPLAPILLGLVLGPLIEQEFRRALSISSGSLEIFFTRPISAFFLAVCALLIVASIVSKVRGARGLAVPD